MNNNDLNNNNNLNDDANNTQNNVQNTQNNTQNVQDNSQSAQNAQNVQAGAQTQNTPADAQNSVQNAQNVQGDAQNVQNAQTSQPSQPAQAQPVQPQANPYNASNGYSAGYTGNGSTAPATDQYNYSSGYKNPSYNAANADTRSAAQNAAPQGQAQNPQGQQGGFSAYSGNAQNANPSANAYSQYQGGYSAPANNGYAANNGGRPVRVKKSGTPLSGRVVALIVCLCLICSAVFGVGGAFVATKYINGDSSSSSGAAETTTSGTVAAPDSSSVQNSDGLSYSTAANSSADGTSASEASVVSASSKASPSVVEIATESVTTSSFFGQYVTQGAGSGVIIDSNGYIITCNHVIDGATSITVTTKDGKKYDATVVGADDQTDIAVIKIDATGLTAATIGSSSSLVVGQTAIAIGNPLGELGGTVTTGIISALDRDITIDGQEYTLLQTSAAINPGNSGGGLFDINGSLIGIVNAKSSSSSSDETTIEGLGFAIPIDSAIDIANQLVKNGYIAGRPMLGISVYEVSSSTSASSLRSAGLSELLNYITDYGVYFIQYSDGQSGDLQYGDRIVAIDNVAVSTLSALKSQLSNYKVGDTVTLTVARVNTSGRMTQSNMIDVKVTLLENVPTASETTSETTAAQ